MSLLGLAAVLFLVLVVPALIAAYDIFHTHAGSFSAWLDS